MIPSVSPSPIESVSNLPRADPGAIAPTGELVEVLGSAAGSVLAAACAHVQPREPVAWVVAGGAVPHPADLEATGVRCDELAIVRAEGERAARAAEMLLGSGGFGLVVVDGCGALRDRSVARLRALCRRHRARLLIAPWSGSADVGLGQPRLGATVALRLSAEHQGRRLELRWAKNKAGQGAPLPAPSLRLPPGCRSTERPADVARLRPRLVSSVPELARVGASA